MIDIITETQNITQNIAQGNYKTYLQTPIIIDTLHCLIAGESNNRSGLVKTS